MYIRTKRRTQADETQCELNIYITKAAETLQMAQLIPYRGTYI